MRHSVEAIGYGQYLGAGIVKYHLPSLRPKPCRHTAVIPIGPDVVINHRPIRDTPFPLLRTVRRRA
jgi:hypothetical protein